MTQEPTVFVVDDDPSLRTAVSRLIGSVGLPVRTFGSADDFLAGVDVSSPGCVVLDVRMPGASGLDLQDQLAAGGYTLPVIFVSAHADVALTVRAMRAGALQVFTKPFDDQALLDAIHQALLLDRQRRLEELETRELQDRFATLTVREREVMRLVVTGMLNKIAFKLGDGEDRQRRIARQLALRCGAFRCRTRANGRPPRASHLCYWTKVQYDVVLGPIDLIRSEFYSGAHQL